MKFCRHIYIFCLILAGATACQDEAYQPFEENENQAVSENEILLNRGYSTYTLPAEKLAELTGCHINIKGGFVFLSDSIVRTNEPLTIEVEQNPYEEERLSNLEFIDQEGMLMQSITLRQASSLSQTQGEAYSGALQRSYGVGYGYDAFGEYASYNSVRDQVISLPALRQYEQANKTSCIVDDFIPDTETSILEGTDSEQLSKSLSAHAGLGLDVGFFQAHVQMGYASNDLKTNTFSFCTIMNNYKAASRHIDPYSLVAIARTTPNILTEGFRHIMNKISAAVKSNKLSEATKYTEELFRIYGTHFIYHADLGGKLEFCSTFERASLDSKTTLSAAAEASFLNMCGFKMEANQTNTYGQVSTRHSRSVSARGGEVTCITEIINCENDVLGNGIIDKWYKSIRLDFNNPKNSNVELIDFKLFPIYEFVTDETARDFVFAYLNLEIGYYDDMFPRVYEKRYAKINTNKFYSNSSLTEYLLSNNQAIIETAAEYVKINKKSYTFRSLYPILSGEVRHEGFAVTNDSLYRILWKGLECTLVPIGRRTDYPALYYNNGDLDIIPSETTDKYSSNYTIKTLSLYSWKNTYNLIYKYGPYMVLEGPGACTKSGQNYYETVVADRPAGWEMFTQEETAKALNELHEKYNIKERKVGLSDNQNYYIYGNNDSQTIKMLTYSKSGDFTINTAKNSSTLYPVLYVRTSSFRY